MNYLTLRRRIYNATTYLQPQGFYQVSRPTQRIHDSLKFWIPWIRFRIPVTGFQTLYVELGFQVRIVTGIPDSLGGISVSIKPWFADSPANFPRVRIPQAKFSRNPESGFPYMGRMCSSYLLKVGIINFEIKTFFYSFLKQHLIVTISDVCNIRNLEQIQVAICQHEFFVLVFLGGLKGQCHQDCFL